MRKIFTICVPITLGLVLLGNAVAQTTQSTEQSGEQAVDSQSAPSTDQLPGQAGKQGSETDPVYLFNEVCYTQVPDVAKIQDMAKRFAWNPMGGDDLQRFTTIKTPSLLEGWDIRLSARIYRLGIVQSEPSDSFIESFPDMADGTATSCTMVLDGRDDAQVILERLNTMVGKQPTTQDVPDARLLTTTWSGGNESVKVFVFYKTDSLQRANLINVTIVSK